MEQQNSEPVWLVGFSPTRASWRVGQAVARGLGSTCRELDLTYETALPAQFEAGGWLVVCAPVYGGHVAPVALDRMAAFRGGGVRTVVVVTYGNRAYDGALTELADFCRQHGCRVVGAAAFVGEHSYSVAAHPVAAGRPDAADLARAEQWGREVAQRPEEELEASQLADRGWQPEVMGAFRQHVQQALASGRTVPPTPAVDAALCTHCGTCVTLCPTRAIAAGHEEQTQADRCIRCCACVKGCPSGARTYDTPFSEALSTYFATPRQPDLW